MPVGPSYRDRADAVAARPRLRRTAVPVTGSGRVCGTSASSAPSSHHLRDVEAVAHLEQLVAEGRASACSARCRGTSTTSRSAPGGAAEREPRGGPVDAPGHAVDQRHGRAVDLEVVVVVGVDLGQRLGVPHLLRDAPPPRSRRLRRRSTPRTRRSATGSVRSGPVDSVTLPRCSGALGHRPPAGAAMHGSPWREPAIKPADQRVPLEPTHGLHPAGIRLAGRAARARCRRRRSDGHDAPGRRPDPRRLRRASRAATRSSTSPGPDVVRERPRRLLRGRLRRRRDQHLRCELGQPRRVRHRRTGSASWPRPGRALAREVADDWSTPDRPRWVLGSVGPGTKLPTLGHVQYAVLRDAYQEQVAGMIAGGVDAVIVETCQDLLQAKAAILGAKRAMAAAGRRCRSSRTSPSRRPARCCSASRSAPR